MDFLHTYGITAIQKLQTTFQGYDNWMLVLSHLGDPRNAFLIYFPISYCMHKPTGALVLILACLSEWINALLKWILHGERPYWWIRESGMYEDIRTLHQYSLTCETGPGSPSGHAMVTASVIFCMVSSLNHHQQLRRSIRWLLWSLFVVFMMAANVSRCFIATHFPHQVVFGTLAGILLTVMFSKVTLHRFKLSNYVFVSIFIPVSCVFLIFSLKKLNFDPQWSITMATRWCERSAWIHLDTTPFNAIYRDAGSILGFGLALSMSSRTLKQENPSVLLRILHIVLSLAVCQVLENLKPTQLNVAAYYMFTCFKFCMIILLVTFVTRLFVKDGVHCSDKKTR